MEHFHYIVVFSTKYSERGFKLDDNKLTVEKWPKTVNAPKNEAEQNLNSKFLKLSIPQQKRCRLFILKKGKGLLGLWTGEHRRDIRRES